MRLTGTESGPREIITPYRPIPLNVPEGLKPNEFFNSAENLNDLVQNNGLLISPENLLLYRKALGHSLEFDASIIYNTSKCILNPLGRPVRRTQLPDNVKHVWNRMNQIMLEYMLEQYPDPEESLLLAGEASLDATWPLTEPGVPSIRMLHNHFIVFSKEELRQAKLADLNNPNLTDGGQHSLFESHIPQVYREFFEKSLDLKILKATDAESAKIALTGYPQGLPSWEIQGGVEALKDICFWQEYDQILKGFLDFYRTFFGQVSTRNAVMPEHVYFPKQVEQVLLFNNDFLKTAKKVRDRCTQDAHYANSIRWQPAFKQLIYRSDAGKLIVTISQNSVGNAITELLGVVVKRVPDTDAYAQFEPKLMEKLFAVRQRLIDADIGVPVRNQYWQEKQTE
ncbi:MAG: hypothetical protein CDV28_13410 [Candidatus Electronema aureum]|uniref:Uncharacterized protein n=1 Tax=Candidatus Electronema aureum TaxID=2005002 RepID=A0A521FZN1_9BACT|nr:MAG: hypothetical protein CDV28_13410 [Candidatus Electronema aureum]